MKLGVDVYRPLSDGGRKMAAERPTIQLRIAPARNNQKRRINWADDFDFAAKLEEQGAIAQLEERLRGTQEVGGSSPPGSIL